LVGDLLGSLHVHDNDSTRDAHATPGNGNIDWEDFSNALREVGFDKVLSFETQVDKDIPIGEERDGMDFEISSAGAFAFLDEHFVLTDAQKASMKEDSRYNAATDKFSLTWPGSNLNREICGYTHNGGNNYTVYYAASNSGGEECNVYWKVVLEHNAPNGKPNRYISIVRVDSIPSNITK
jgi:hypothetical protein